MSANTKVIVLKAKELIYTGIFLFLGILLAALLVMMFLPSKSQKDPAASHTSTYVPGVYSSTIQLGENTLDVQVTVDADHIKSVDLKSLDETIQTMYPLIEPSLASINEQLSSISSIDELTFDDETQYTNTILKQAIKNALKKAQP